MSLLPASFGSRRTQVDDAPPRAPEDESHKDVFNLIPPRAEAFERPRFERPYGLHRPVDLDAAKLEALYARPAEPAEPGPPEPDAAEDLPPEATGPDATAPEAAAEPAVQAFADPEPEPPAEPEARTDARAAGGMDLTRLSIDDAGRLYWDGRPVEVRRRLEMSRAQILGAGAIGVLVLVAALGAAVQGTATAHEWACARGLIDAYCTASRIADIPL